MVVKSTDALEHDKWKVVELYGDGVSASSIARQYGVSVWSVITRLRNCGVRIRSSEEQNRVVLSEPKTDRFSYYEVVDGVLLGDGQIDPKNILHLEQTISRKGWVLQVQRHLKQTGASSKIIPIASRVRIIEGRRVISKEGNHLYTPSYMENRELRKKWYGTGVKMVPRDLVLTPVVLSHWVAGDGTAHRNGLTICTNGFHSECLEFLISRFKKDLGIIVSIGRTSREGQFVLNIHRRNEAVKVRNLIIRRLPKCCRYKLRLIRSMSKLEEKVVLRGTKNENY